MTQPDANPVPVDAVGVAVARRSDGVVVLLDARGPIVDLHVRRIRDLVSLARTVPPRTGREHLSRRLARFGAHTGLTLRVCLRGREVVRVAADARPCRISRALGLSSSTVRIVGLVHAVFSRSLPLPEISRVRT